MGQLHVIYIVFLAFTPTFGWQKSSKHYHIFPDLRRMVRKKKSFAKAETMQVQHCTQLMMAKVAFKDGLTHF